MTVGFYIGMFIIFFYLAYAVIGSKEAVVSRGFSNYAEWLREHLDIMYYDVSIRNVRWMIGISAAVLGVIGFALPGKFSEIETFRAVERIIELNKNEKYDDALLMYNEFRGADFPIVHNELGVAYMGTQKYDMAEKELKRAIALLPEYSKPYYNLAHVYSKTARNVEADFELKRAKEAAKYVISEDRLYGEMKGDWSLKLLFAILFGYAGYRIPGWVVRFMKWRRIRKFEEQLPDGLMMAASAMRAGQNLDQSIQLVAKESGAPLNQEFSHVVKDQEIGGISLEESLQRLNDRMPTMDNRIFVNSVLLLKAQGGNMPKMFETIANTIQQRKRVQQKIKTMTAEGEAQAYMLAVLPIVMFVVLDKLNPEIYSLMYTTKLGWLMILAMIIMEAAGLYLMLKIVRVKI